MKNRATWPFLTVLVLGLALALGAAPGLAQGIATATAPELPGKPPGWGGGTESLAGSLVVFDPVAGDTAFLTGTSQTFCFRAESFSGDWEYAYSVWLRFPTDWTVTDVYVQGTPSCTSTGTWGTFGWGFQTSPYEVQVNHARYHASAGDHCTAHYCFDVTSGTGTPDADVSWYWDGDGYGSAPHWPCSDDGYTPVGQSTCDEQVHPPAVIPAGALDPIMLTPPVINAEGCPCELQEHELMVWNNTGADTTVNLSYAITQGGGTCTGPAQVAVTDGATVPFTVEVTPVGDPDDVVVCQVDAVDAADPGNTDTALITKTLISGGFDPAGWQLEPVTGATSIQWAGAAVGTHPSAAGPVGYVVGGLGAGSSTPNPDLQMFDPATGTWTQLPDMPNVRFSPAVGWIGGLLYVAGGYDTGFAATNDLQVFNPVAGTWDNTTPADMPNPRGGGAGGVGTCSSGTGECLFHVGGGPDSSFATTTQETWQYNPAANTWSQLDNKPAGSSPDGHILGAGVGCLGRIYIAGDYRGFHHFYRLDATQPAGSQWAPLASLPAAAGAMTPTLVCKEDWGALVLMGGDPDGGWGTYNTTVFLYDIATDSWEGPIPETLHVGQLGAAGWHLDGKVWSVGGTVGSGAIVPMPFESLLQINCEPCEMAGISLVKTVGTEPGVCAATTEITVPGGTQVYYCFTVTNTGEVTLNLHDLVDDHIGDVMSDTPYSLLPGASYAYILGVPIVINAEVTNTATWTAYNVGGSQAQAQASATVYVAAMATVTVLADPAGGGIVSGGGPYSIGALATVLATPNPGWIFRHWLVNGSEITANPYTFEVTGDITLTAIFQEIQAIPSTGFLGVGLLLVLLAGAGVFMLRRL